uniref:Uncharacterized protein n=1 Tax=Ciona savignyi TaxID=51511 RepID=H2ZQF7_CIOSA
MLSPLDGVADEYKAVPVSRKLDTTVEPRTKSGTSPFDLNISGTTQTSGLSKERVNKTPASSVSSVKLANEKLDNPEQSLVNAISMVESTDPENWAVITDNIFIIRRMAKFHPAVLASKIHDVMLLLCKNVHNLRSQVC